MIARYTEIFRQNGHPSLFLSIFINGSEKKNSQQIHCLYMYSGRNVVKQVSPKHVAEFEANLDEISAKPSVIVLQ